MGSVSSICKCRQRPASITIVHDQSTQTRCLPSKSVTGPSSQHGSRMRRSLDAPFRLTVLDKSPSSRGKISAHHSHTHTIKPLNPTSARTDHVRTQVPPLSAVAENEHRCPHYISDQPQRVERSPTDVFVIDISNEQVRIGQPISINIRHLRMGASQHLQAETSTPTASYINENFLDSLADACEKYPNPVADPDQPTQKALHAYFRA